MELKQDCYVAKLDLQGLLIVPYGIETEVHQARTRQLHSLLIVPYGIETTVFQGAFCSVRYF